MKKTSYIYIIFMSLLWGACSNDIDSFIPSQDPEELDYVHLNVGLDKGIKTRADDPDGAPVITGMDVRYKLETWIKSSEEGSEYKRWGNPIVQTTSANESYTHAKGSDANKFDLALPKGADIKIAVWVDYVDTDQATDKYYNTSNFAGITVAPAIAYYGTTPYPYYITDDYAKYHAYSGVLSIANGANISSVGSLEAKRPFAQVNIKANDAGSDWNENFVFDANSYLNITTVFASSTAYNAITKEAYCIDTSESFFYMSRSNIWCNNMSSGSVVFSSLIFANESPETTNLLVVTEAKAKDKNNTGEYYFTFGYSTNILSVPIQRNKITNISGNLLMQSTSFSVTIGDDFLSGSNERTF